MFICCEKEVRRVFGNRIANWGEYLCPKGGKTAQEWENLNNEELHNLCSSRNIVRLIISRQMRWPRHMFI
jgi:hypothetical protein